MFLLNAHNICFDLEIPKIYLNSTLLSGGLKVKCLSCKYFLNPGPILKMCGKRMHLNERSFRVKVSVARSNVKLMVGCQIYMLTFEPVHEISNNVVCATSKAPSLIRAFASILSIL